MLYDREMNFLYAAKLLEHIRLVLEDPAPIEKAKSDKDTTARSAENDEIRPPKSKGTVVSIDSRGVPLPPRPEEAPDYTPKLQFVGPATSRRLPSIANPPVAAPSEVEPPPSTAALSQLPPPPTNSKMPEVWHSKARQSAAQHSSPSSTLDVRDSELINSPAPIRNPAWSQKAQQFAAQSSSYTAVTRDPAKSSKPKR